MAFNAALCCMSLGDRGAALGAVAQALDLAPQMEKALRLQAELSGGAGAG